MGRLADGKQLEMLPTKEKKIGLRWGLAVIFFIVGFIAYMDRSNISIVAIPMMKELGMNKVEFGLLSSLFYLGYCFAQIPGGLLAEKYGARKIVTVAVTWWSIFTSLTAVTSNYIVLCIVRFFFGAGEGPMYPGNAVFNSYWFQKHEKGRASSALLAGSFFGPVIAPGISVAIMVWFGWHGVFYIFGIMGVAVALVWYFVGRDKPEQHPWISEGEKMLIIENRSISNSQKKSAPWKQYLRNYRFWAVGVQYLVVIYMNTFFLTWLPTYLIEVRNFSLKEMGFAASFPWLAICFSVLIGGAVSDKILQKTNSRMIARGGMAIVGFIFFILGLYLAAYSGSPWSNVVWLTVALGALGLPIVASWALANDLGQEFSGSVSGWMNTWGSIGGITSPILCGWFAQEMGWNTTLLINIIPVVFAGLLWFLIKPDRPLVSLENK
ncbi:MFS transporter [Neobacillus ginsengisoli]|uniref:ACS family glucarate transporter-like MFS transporter n=1 Tax=Neobacillus ginsengisoli TaxID=904295 RepID=A0ABT9XV28_9BACI|nr:MFS transporter [Neobacillus ginsengisoli]MDQ0199431.1 ACS family glucarate transporter-like MFS transporter [Neobacillus ginsengisoli]